MQPGRLEESQLDQRIRENAFASATTSTAPAPRAPGTRVLRDVGILPGYQGILGIYWTYMLALPPQRAPAGYTSLSIFKKTNPAGLYAVLFIVYPIPPYDTRRRGRVQYVLREVPSRTWLKPRELSAWCDTFS
jgi:hypothetical protein